MEAPCSSCSLVEPFAFAWDSILDGLWAKLFLGFQAGSTRDLPASFTQSTIVVMMIRIWKWGAFACPWYSVLFRWRGVELHKMIVCIAELPMEKCRERPKYFHNYRSRYLIHAGITSLVWRRASVPPGRWLWVGVVLLVVRLLRFPRRLLHSRRLQVDKFHLPWYCTEHSSLPRNHLQD